MAGRLVVGLVIQGGGGTSISSALCLFPELLLCLSSLPPLLPFLYPSSIPSCLPTILPRPNPTRLPLLTETPHPPVCGTLLSPCHQQVGTSATFLSLSKPPLGDPCLKRSVLFPENLLPRAFGEMSQSLLSIGKGSPLCTEVPSFLQPASRLLWGHLPGLSLQLLDCDLHLRTSGPALGLITRSRVWLEVSS